MALARFLSNFSAGPVRNFRSGNTGVSALLCIADFGVTKPDTAAMQRAAEFQSRHNLSGSQFMMLADVLSSDLVTAKKLSGSRYFDYEQHFDYKLRRGNFARSKTSTESLSSLRSTYAGYQEAMIPGDSRADHVNELLDLFKVHGTDPDVSTWGDQEFNCILKNIHDLESEWGTRDVSNRMMLNDTFDDMKADLREDPFNFVVDSLTFLKSQLALYNSELPTQEPALLEQAPSELETQITQEWESKQLNNLSQANLDALRVYNNEDADHAQVLSAETLPVTRRFIHKAVALATATGYAWAVFAGVGTYTFLAGVPLIAGVAVHVSSYDRSYDSTEVVKDIFLRKEDNKLDVYLWQAGQYTRVIEGVEAANLEVLSGNPMVSDFGAVPFNVRDKDLTLGQLKGKGLPAPLNVVNINGKAHFMHQNYRLNKNNSSILNFV